MHNSYLLAISVHGIKIALKSVRNIEAEARSRSEFMKMIDLCSLSGLINKHGERLFPGVHLDGPYSLDNFIR
jgi:hypothetical protein